MNSMIRSNTSMGPYHNIWGLRGKILIIAEKPKAARKIAEALSLKFETMRFNNIPYYVIKKDDSTVIIASAVGHLYTLHTNISGYPVFEYTWTPAFKTDPGRKYVKSYYDLLVSLFKTCNYYINACDYDIEGSVIGFLLIKYLGDETRSYRARFSSLTPQELRDSFNKLTSLDYNMIEAGLCRHELDWLWGINISRALMNSIYKSTSRKIVLSAGRVQTPTLKYISEYENKRRLFIPIPQYSITLVLEKNGEQFNADYLRNPVETEKEALIIKEKLEKSRYIIVRSYSVNKQKYNPPPPFNLSDLQEEASKIYGFSPIKTQEIAEQLYLEALISYPRTNSQKLPPTLNYHEILNKLTKISDYKKLISRLLSETGGRLKPREGEKEDPAHPAIYPTGVLPENLTREQWALYDLIVRRFLATFAQVAIVSQVKAELSTLDQAYVFTTSGITVETPGWFYYYPFHTPSSKVIPTMRAGERVEIIKINVRESYSKPPARLKKIDILRWMEKVEIGTESTRALIIEKLFDRGYLKSTRSGVEITDLGIGVVEVISTFFPDLVSVELTRKFEILMNDIIKGRKRREDVINEARSVIKQLIGLFNQNIDDVGLHLAKKLSLIDNYKKCIVPTCRGDEHSKGLCKIHYTAYENILRIYEEWARRKNITFEKYLSEIRDLRSTGAYVKEVIKHYFSLKT
ncbi:MAG: DNA topoisomerase I [Desulfurococcaceae archaeon]